MYADNGLTMASIFPHAYPRLPNFKTLLIYGPYHPSAPLHLCLSHNALAPTNNVLLIAPSRVQLQAALKEFNDEWIDERGGYGSTAGLAMRTQMLFVLYFLSCVLVRRLLTRRSVIPQPRFTLPSSCLACTKLKMGERPVMSRS